MSDPVRARSVLRRFADLGLEIAIDDFGAGYTSLAHLRNLPVHELKIDQSLVRQMADSAADTVIIQAIIDLAHNLGLRTVAEGVEDAETLDRLRGLGCDIAQGFYLARPMAGADLDLWSQGHLIPAPRLIDRERRSTPSALLPLRPGAASGS
jgi:EAL domain-containing protein (putative c-di-GMP-specific phosphodiesterase class I)